MPQKLVGVKTCTKCGRELPLSEFYWHNKNNLPRPSCKTCCNKQSSRDYYLSREERKLKRRQHYENNKEWYYQREEKKKRERRLKAKASWAVSNALRYGKVVKPKYCCICGVETLVDAHHEDYNKPLIILWLCRPCHAKIHRRTEYESFDLQHVNH